MDSTEQEKKDFLRLEDLYFDREYLVDFITTQIPQEDWYVFNCGKLRWTVRESYQTLRTECTKFNKTAFFRELMDLFTVDIGVGDMIFTKTPPPGIPPHIDRNRSAAINFPVTGTFKNSPMTWYQTFDTKTKYDSYTHSDISTKTDDYTAVLFDPTKIHGVENKDDDTRCLLSVWWRNSSYNDIAELWRNGELINQEANERNKFVKVLK